eukprot:m.244384 g.244384  ORF g.244384 m.244384 type:complete len:342 (-) comp19471_c0_seq6:586-1611(-)
MDAAASAAFSQDNGDDDDYMSDKFLSSLDPKTTKVRHVDPRWETPAWKRKAKLQEKIAANEKRQRLEAERVNEHEARNIGLATPISSDNKGFKMLAKMGYAKGQGLGKNGAGRSEPVGVDVKSGRHGLGRESLLAKQKEVRAAAIDARRRLREKRSGRMQESFREQMRMKYENKQAERDLPPAQRACEELDTARGITDSILWFRPPSTEHEVDADDCSSITIVPTGDGDTRRDEQTQRLSCDKQAVDSTGDAPEDTSAVTSEQEAFDNLPAMQRLEMVTAYLRSAHFYCYWYVCVNACTASARVVHQNSRLCVCPAGVPLQVLPEVPAWTLTHDTVPQVWV